MAVSWCTYSPATSESTTLPWAAHGPACDRPCRLKISPPKLAPPHQNPPATSLSHWRCEFAGGLVPFVPTIRSRPPRAYVGSTCASPPSRTIPRTNWVIPVYVLPYLFVQSCVTAAVPARTRCQNTAKFLRRGSASVTPIMQDYPSPDVDSIERENRRTDKIG